MDGAQADSAVPPLPSLDDEPDDEPEDDEPDDELEEEPPSADPASLFPAVSALSPFDPLAPFFPPDASEGFCRVSVT